MKVACYLRISTGMQTLANQRALLEKYVSDKGWTCDYYEEIESSRKTRPIKAAMLQRLRNHEYDGVVVTRLDRFARSSRELILDIDEILKKNIFFISVIDNLDFTTASGKLHFHIMCAFSEFERCLIADRVRQSLQRLKSEGKKLGRPQGSGDKKRRKKSGYLLREARKRQNKDQDAGSYKHIEEYLK